MSQHHATRTLVKSPPELWEVCSDAAALGRHLEPFGEIRITRLEPETTVAWEGERASGTVRIEPSGWGTRVTLTASSPDPEPVAQPAPLAPAAQAAAQPAQADTQAAPLAQPEPGAEPEPPPDPQPRRRLGLWRRLARLAFDTAVPTVAVPEEGLVPREAAEQVDPPPAPPATPEPGSDVVDALRALEAALDSLGQAHHRPFSRG